MIDTPARDPFESLSRRRFLALGAAAGLLGAGRLVGAEAAPPPPTPGPGPAEPPAPKPFHFVYINDTHVRDASCVAFLRKAMATIQELARETPVDFVLHGGDVTLDAHPPEFELFRPLVREFRLPLYLTPGNHDYVGMDRSGYDGSFPNMANFRFEHKGWQFIGFDSTEGTKYALVSVQPSTLAYLTAELPRVDARVPLVAFTHLPFGDDVRYRPRNANAVLSLFARHSLVGVLSGHFHSLTERRAGQTLFTTCRCLSVSRDNHDGTKEKGFLLFTAAGGRLAYRFVEVKP
jgi:predicted phosphodiesterase